MKYLKKFENTIKHTDDIAINHPLRNFSRDFEDIIINIKNLDNIQNSTVKRYFTDNENHKITIIYKNNTDKFIKINLYVDKNEKLVIEFLLREHWWSKKLTQNTEIFMNLILNKLDNFLISNLNFNRDIILTFKFPLIEQNNIIDELNDFESYANFYMDTINFNL